MLEARQGGGDEKKKNLLQKHPDKSGSQKKASDSIKSGVLIAGMLLLLIGLAILFVNENKYAGRIQTISQSGGPVIRLTPGQANPANNGKLVFIAGVTNINKPLTDPLFMPPLKAIALKRKVEMYQWQEQYETQTLKTVEGGETKVSVPTYTKVWSPEIIDSSVFKKLTTHRNPRKMPFQAKIWRASEVSVGGFKLSATLANRLNTYLQLRIKSKKHLQIRLKNKVKLHKDSFFIGNDPQKPEIGDMRVTLHGVRQSEVSIIARQEGNALKPYISRTGKRIELLRQGIHPPDDMLPMPQSAPSWLIWSIRLGGFILIYFGLNLIFKAAPPLSGPTSSRFVRLAATDAGLSAILIAPALVLLPIAIAWIIVQPLSGSIFLAIAILLAFAAAFVLKWLSEPSSISENKITRPQNKTATEEPSTLTNASTKKLTASDWLKKGQKMYAEENYNGAIDAFSAAIYLDSKYILAYYNRAIMYQKDGQAKLAIIDLKSAARLGHKRARAFLKAKKIAWE